MLMNVADFATPADAIAAARHGDRIYFPGRSDYTAPIGGWYIDKSLEIFGDGPGVPGGSGTFTLAPANDDDPVFRILGSVRGVAIRDLQLRGSGLGAGNGILVDASVDDVIVDLQLARLAVRAFGGHGISIGSHDPGNKVIQGVSLLDLHVSACGGTGIRLQDVSEAYVAGCMLESNGRSGLQAIASEVLISQCLFSGNVLSTSISDPLEGNLKLEDCLIARVDACSFNNLSAGNVHTGIGVVGSPAAIIGSCTFANPDGAVSTTGVMLSAAAGPAVILANHFRYVYSLVKVNSGAVDCVVLPQHDETSSGSIDLPSPNGGMFAVPHVNQGGTNQMRGILVPSYPSDPTTNLQEGMLIFNTSQQEFRIYAKFGTTTTKWWPIQVA